MADGMAQDQSGLGTNQLSVIVQIVGIAVLICGLIGAYQVVWKAWSLLDNPTSIVPFAEEIEKETQLNRYLGQFNIMVEFFEKANRALPAQAAPSPASVYDPVPYPTKVPPNSAKPAPDAAPPSGPFAPNASYFVAWTITIIILGLIARIALRAVAEGGKLVVIATNQDQQLKRVIKELATELRSPLST